MAFDNGIWEAPDGATHRYSRMSWPAGKGITMTVDLPGDVKAKGVCAYGWDQDRKCQTIFFTGFTDKGVPVWGQRIPPEL